MSHVNHSNSEKKKWERSSSSTTNPVDHWLCAEGTGPSHLLRPTRLSPCYRWGNWHTPTCPEPWLGKWQSQDSSPNSLNHNSVLLPLHRTFPSEDQCENSLQVYTETVYVHVCLLVARSSLGMGPYALHLKSLKPGLYRAWLSRHSRNSS